MSETSKPYRDHFSAVLKVHASTIHLEAVSKPNGQHSSYRIICRDLAVQTPKADVQLVVLNTKGSLTDHKGLFHSQQAKGQPLEQDDIAIFMTAPIKANRASLAFDLGISQHSSSLEDLNEEICRKLGSAFLLLDTDFATSGTQKLPIMVQGSPKPIGHMQVEYLIVRNPNAYNVEPTRPDWLTSAKQLDAGHRGSGSGCRSDVAHSSLTENTIASFNYAYHHGADMCELDVICTADGIPVVYHNFCLDNVKPGVTQIDQLTLAELRAAKDCGVHDKNCNHDLYGSHDSDCYTTSRPFPTLAEVLDQVDPACALNIELKWPQLLTNGKREAYYHRETNDNVDRILQVIQAHSRGRAIILSTFNADVAIMLRLKQTQFPVLFLTTSDSKRFSDAITKTIKNAIHFAKAFDLAGVNPNAAHLTEPLVRYAQDCGLLVYTWGKIESAQAVKDLRRMGANGIIYDRIDLIKPRD